MTVPVSSNNDGPPFGGTTSDVDGSEFVFGLPEDSPAASSQQVKLQTDISLSTFSESEESGASEIKSKEQGKGSYEIDGKAVLSAERVSIPVLSSRKISKPATEEELGDGMPRQGRTGHRFDSTRSLMPEGVEKLSNIREAKQLRSSKLNVEKSESKPGQPPTRKLSDRKAYKRQKHTASSSSQDFIVGSDNEHEELLAAVNAVMSLAGDFPSSFWRLMEPYFTSITGAHIAFLKQEGELVSATPSPIRISTNSDNCEVLPEQPSSSATDFKFTPLYQRLLSALIPDDSDSLNGEFEVVGDETETKHDDESDYSVLDHVVDSNGYSMSEKLEYEELEDLLLSPRRGIKITSDDCIDRFADHVSVDYLEWYHDLGIDEKIILEAQSIGIYIEQVFAGEINKLEEDLHQEALKKKEIIDRILQPVLERKELQEKEFDQYCYDKLIEIAYEKCKASCHHQDSGAKSSSGKITEQAALAFAKRTLERCHEYEITSKSCFREPTFRERFLSGFSQVVCPPIDTESMQLDSATLPSSSSKARTGRNGDNHANTSGLLSHGNSSLMEDRLPIDDADMEDSLSSSTKGKRSERDRDGEGTNKTGRPSLSNANLERKLKAKGKQITSQVSASVKISEQPNSSSSSPSSSPTTNFSESNELDDDDSKQS